MPKSAKKKGKVRESKIPKTDLATVSISEDWNVNIQLLVENQIEDVEHIKVLTNAIRVPLRRKFSILIKDELMAKVREFGDTKNKKGQKQQVPHSDVLEGIHHCMEKGEEVPVVLWAKLLKIGLLEIKSEHYKPSSAVEDSNSSRNLAGKKGGRKSAGKSRKSNAPLVPKQADSKQMKEWSGLKKRTEEQVAVAFIDDEPETGPDHYVLVVGFYRAEMLSLLEHMGVQLNGVMQVRSGSYEDFNKLVNSPKPPILLMQEPQLSEEELKMIARKRESDARRLEIFWKLLPHVFTRNKSNGWTQDVATHQLVISSDLLPNDWHNYNKMMVYGGKLFDQLATFIYDTVENLRQYKTFLRNLNVVEVPKYSEQVALAQQKKNAPPAVEPNEEEIHQAAQQTMSKKKDSVATEPAMPPSVEPEIMVPDFSDMRHYNELLKEVPQESASVPLILHCLVEQVVATEEGQLPVSEIEKQPRSDGVDHVMALCMAEHMHEMALTEEEQQMLSEDLPKLKELLAKDDFEAEKKQKGDAPKIINYHDEVRARTHYLRATDQLDASKAEEAMLQCTIANKIVSGFREDKPAEMCKERSARLHELMRDQTMVEGGSQVRVTASLLDRAFRQFVFESMPLSHVDGGGKVVRSGANQPSINNFWDDPYDIIMREANNIMENVDQQAIDELIKDCVPQLSPDQAQMIRNNLLVRSLNKSVDAAESDNEVETIEKDQTAMLYQAITTHNQLKPRQYLDEFVYSEHMDNKVLLQVVEESRMCYPCMDSYQHKRDGTTLLVFHHPISNQLDTKLAWFNNVYSNVGFRNYMYHVAGGIEEWTAEQDVLYEKEKAEEEMRRVIEQSRNAQLRPPSPATTKKKGKSGKRGSKDQKPSPMQKPPKESKSAEDNAEDANPVIVNPFVLPGSLKDEDMMRQLQKLESSPELGKKKGSKGKLNDAKRRKSGGRSSRSSRQASPSSRPNSRGRKGKRTPSPSTSRENQSHEAKLLKEPIKKKLPFVGFDVKNELIQVGGNETFVYPSDGGVVSAQRISYTQGRTHVRVKVAKDGHVITCHVLEPTDHDEEAKLMSLLQECQEFGREGGQEEQRHQDGHHPTKTSHDNKRKSSHHNGSHGNGGGSGGHHVVCFDDESKKASEAGKHSVEKSLQQQIEMENCHSQFGSTCAVFCDNMVLSYSLHGETGYNPNADKLKNEIGKILEKAEVAVEQLSKPSVAPADVQAAPTAATNQAAKKGKKAKDSSPAGRKSPKDKRRSKGVVQDSKTDVAQAQEEAQVKEEVQPQNCNHHQKSDTQRQPQLYVSCPNGLTLCYNANTSKNGEVFGPTVRQYYPQPIGEEISRVIMYDGTVVKNMKDGSTQILCLDGTVHTAGFDEGNYPKDDQNTPNSPSYVGDSYKKNSVVQGGVVKGGNGRKSNAKEEKRASNSHRNPAVYLQPSDIYKLDGGDHTDQLWQTTSICGDVSITCHNKPSQPITKRVCYVAKDPITREVMYSLEDSTVLVERPDGGLVCDHEDGTRITKFFTYDQFGHIVWLVRVECEGFATVTFDLTNGESMTLFGSGTTLSMSQDQDYKLSHWTGGIFVLSRGGTALYRPAPESPPTRKRSDTDISRENVGGEENFSGEEEQVTYLLRHNDPVCFEMSDFDGNVFQIRNNGCVTSYNAHQGCVEEYEDEEGENPAMNIEGQQKYLKKYAKHPPRLFVVKNDGSGYELLRHSDVKPSIQAAELDQFTAVVKDQLLGDTTAVGLTIMRPHHNDLGQVWKLDKIESEIIPPNIRSRDLQTYDFWKPVSEKIFQFGHKKGRGLAIGSLEPPKPTPVAPTCPDTLEVRQLVRHPEISNETRSMLQKRFLEFVRKLSREEIHRKLMQMEDPREEGEVRRAEDLLTLLLHYDDNVKMLSPHKDSNAPIDREEEIIPTNVQPLGDVVCMKHNYEKALSPEKPPTPRRASVNLTREDWDQIREELLEESCNRNALRYKKVPTYFQSEEGREWLRTQTELLNEASKRLKPRQQMSVLLGNNDEKVYVGKHPIDKMNVTSNEESILEVNELRRKSMAAKEEKLQRNSVNAQQKSILQQINESVSTDNEKPYKENGEVLSNQATNGSTKQRDSSFINSNVEENFPENKSSPPPLETDALPGNDDEWKQRRFDVMSWPNDVIGPRRSRHPVAPPIGRQTQARPIDSDEHILRDFYRQRRPGEVKMNKTEAVVQKGGKVKGEKGVSDVIMQSLLAFKPNAVPNTKYIEIEEPVRKQVNNVSIAGPISKGNMKVMKRGVELHPRQLNLGKLVEGKMYCCTFRIRNVGIDTIKYRIKSPPVNTGIRIRYAPKKIPAGLEQKVTIDICAIAPNVLVGDIVGSLNYQLQIIAETEIIHLPIRATILLSNAYNTIENEEEKCAVVKFNSNVDVKSCVSGDLV